MTEAIGKSFEQPNVTLRRRNFLGYKEFSLLVVLNKKFLS